MTENETGVLLHFFAALLVRIRRKSLQLSRGTDAAANKKGMTKDMSNRLFQGIIYQMKDAVDRVIGVIDDSGIVISCSELGRIGEARQGVREELTYASDVVVMGGYTYRSLNTATKNEYIVFVEGEDKTADKLSMILSISLLNIKNLYDDKHDKSSFIKNIILDNILPSDIYAKSKELHFATDVSRVVFLIKFNGKNDIIPYDVMQNMFPGKNKDYVINVGERDSVLVKEVKTNYDMKEMEEVARNISDTISSEFYTKVSIGIGTVVNLFLRRKMLVTGFRPCTPPQFTVLWIVPPSCIHKHPFPLFPIPGIHFLLSFLIHNRNPYTAVLRILFILPPVRMSRVIHNLS